MASTPKVLDYVTVFLDELQRKLGSKVDTNEGSRWDALAGGFGRMFVRSNQMQVAMFDAHERERAKGPDLDAYCERRGPIRRFGAQKSRGFVRWTRATSAFGATSIPAGHKIRAPYSGRPVVFEVLYTRSVGVSELNPEAYVQAVTPGSDGNVGTISAPGVVANIDTLDDTSLLPTFLQVAQGCAEELDDELLVRQRLYEEGRERGTRPAVALGALMVNGVKHVVVAARDDNHYGGQGCVYVGDRDWQSTDLMVSDVYASLESWRGMQSIAVRKMTSSDVSIVADVDMADAITKYNIEEIRATAVRKVLEYFDNRKTPYEYSPASIGGRIERAHDDIMRVTVTSPASAVPNPFTPSQLVITGFPALLTRYRTSASLITLNFRSPL